MATGAHKSVGLTTPDPSVLEPLHTAFSDMLNAVNKKLGTFLPGTAKDLAARRNYRQSVAPQLERLFLAEFLTRISKPGEDGQRVRAAMLKVLSEVESPDFDIRTLSIFTSPYALSVAQRDETLTSEEAAKILNVSRTHMVKLIDGGLIAGAEKTEGRHRRVPKAAVLAYKKASRVKQAKGYTRMVEASERMGLYDAELARARKRA